MQFLFKLRSALACSAAVFGLNATAATIPQNTYDQLMATATREGAVSVTVTLEAAGLDVLLSDKLQQFRSRASIKKQALKGELGQSYWAVGQWDDTAA